MKTQLNTLKLVYPPISNQEAEWFRYDSDVEDVLKESNLYMIAQREEGKYKFEDCIDLTIPVSLYNINTKLNGKINLNEILKYKKISKYNLEIEIELSEKLIRAWQIDPKSKNKNKIIDWFTTEKILFDKWRGHPGIQGFENYRDLTKYHLHYVGISKKQNSFMRLLKNPHDKIIRILSNEMIKSKDSRLPDELFFFFFKIDSIGFKQHDDNQDYSTIDSTFNETLEKEKIISDAEKAFVNILKPKYNKIKFSNYPKGTDGIFDYGLESHSYQIGEDIIFSTDYKEIVGSFNSNISHDIINIKGDKVFLTKLG